MPNTPSSSESIANPRSFFPELLNQLKTTQTLTQFIKYFITGLISFGTEVSLLFILTHKLKLWYIHSNSFALIIVFIINFTLNRFWSFKSKQPFLKQFFTSGILCLVNLLVGNGFMYLFTDIFGLFYIISKIIVVGMAVTWNFFLYKYYVYK